MLHRVAHACPSCGAVRHVSTGPLGTQVRTTCQPSTCRLARIIRLAGRYQDAVEILPVDDSRAPKKWSAA